jgi:hypothetical protein
MKKLKLVGYALFSAMLIGCGGGGDSTPKNIAPEATDKAITLNENQNKQVTLDATDEDGNSLTYKIVKAPSHGTFEDGIYTPTAGYVGMDSFTFIANDGTVDSAPATITITITADFDGDDISDALDTDDDNDGVLDKDDTFPLDASETLDTDNDGIGNNTDTDDDNDGISDANEIINGTDPLVSDTVTVSGKIEYERVNPLHNGNSSRLDSSNITIESAKEVIVKAVDSSGIVVSTTATNSNGEYILTNLPKDSDVKIRVYAKMFKENKWDIKVIDNTNNNAQYIIEGELTTTGTSNSIRNLKATASTKTSPPFAVLDSVYLAIKKVLSVDSEAQFPSLNMKWSVNNVESGTYYDGVDTIILQGDQSGDSDEYDNHIIVHEWGHYFEDKFSRADSIGGQHGSGESLDIRLAFGEGWGNAWSAIATDDPIYFDTIGNNGWNMNIESATKNNQGWFSEASIQRILYDLYDAHDDDLDTLTLGFQPLYNVLVGSQKTTPAFTSIFSFIKALKDENPNEQGDIDSIGSSENIATIEDIYGTGRTNRVNSYPYIDYLSLGRNVSITTSISDGGSANYGFNKLSNRRYIRFSVPSNRSYKITVKQTNGTNADPDFFVYQALSPIQFVGKSEGPPNNGMEEYTLNLLEGNYLIDIVNWSSNNAEFNVQIEAN